MTSLDSLEVTQVAFSIIVLIVLAVRWAPVPELDPLGTRIDRAGTPQGARCTCTLPNCSLSFCSCT